MNKNKGTAKFKNQIIIFSLLKNEGALSRKNIADKLGLTRASITQLTNGMIELGMIEEIGMVENVSRRAGRKEILVDIKEDFCYLLSIDIEINFVSIGVVTVRGKALAKKQFDFDLASYEVGQLELLIKKLNDAVESVIKKSKVPVDKIFYGGVGMVGRKNYYHFHKMKIPPILNNRKIIASNLAQRFKIPFIMDNNVRALAVAEAQFFSKSTLQSYLFIKFGPGLGSAIVIENELYKGINERAGELGNIIVTEFYPNIPTERRITLEEVISAQFMRNELQPVWNPALLPYLYHQANGDIENLNTTLIYHSLLEEEPVIMELYHKKMKILAQQIFNVKNILDLNKTYLLFSTGISEVDTLLYKLLIQELKLLSEELANQVSRSKISKSELYLAGAAIAYMEGVENF